MVWVGLVFFKKTSHLKGLHQVLFHCFIFVPSALYKFQDLSGTGSSEGSSPVYFYQY